MIAFHMFCHEDAKLAREIPRRQFEDYFAALFESAGEWTQGTSSKDYKGYDVSISRMKNSTLESQIETGGAWVGTPDEIKAIIRRFEDARRQIRARLAADQFRHARFRRGAKIDAPVRQGRDTGVFLKTWIKAWPDH